jgi:tetratricopeptide (TPR) repeat protein
MSIKQFISKLLLPIGILLQVLGYAETAHKFFGLPEPFLFASTGFLLTIACLVWLVWFSGNRVAATTKDLSLGVLVVVSVAYYVLVQYEVISQVEHKIVQTSSEIESARALAYVDGNSAIERINRVVDRFPDIAELYNIRGVAFKSESRFREALNDFQTAARLDPAIRQYQINIALAEASMCDFQEEKKLLNTYVGRYQTDMQGRYNRGVVLQILNEQDNALADYKVIIGNNAQSTEAALFNSAVIYAAKTPQAPDPPGILQRVFQLLEGAIRLNPFERIQKIKAALIPVSQRAPLCDERKYATDDLTPVASFPQFVDWLRKQLDSVGEKK